MGLLRDLARAGADAAHREITQHVATRAGAAAREGIHGGENPHPVRRAAAVVAEAAVVGSVAALSHHLWEGVKARRGQQPSTGSADKATE